MIQQLNIFSVDSYVVADDWNANFKVIEQSNEECKQAITDANEQIAFPDSDLEPLFESIREKPNSFAIPATNVIIAPQSEYYKTLTSGQDLNIQIPTGLNSEARIILKLNDQRTLLPISITYSGTQTLFTGDFSVYPAGFYFIFIYETAGNAIIKMVKTGV